jgi:hypothetical protein
MKATLEFNLPEDQTDYETATFGHRYRGTLEELDRDLRNSCKHLGIEWACQARELLHTICDENGIVLHEGVNIGPKGLLGKVWDFFKRWVR